MAAVVLTTNVQLPGGTERAVAIAYLTTRPDLAIIIKCCGPDRNKRNVKSGGLGCKVYSGTCVLATSPPETYHEIHDVRWVTAGGCGETGEYVRLCKQLRRAHVSGAPLHVAAKHITEALEITFG